MKKTIILLSLASVCVCGCAGNTPNQHRESAERRPYSAVVLSRFSLQDAAISTSEDLQAFAKHLESTFSTTIEKSLRRVRLPEGITVLKAETEQGEQVAQAVVVEGRFTRISGGSMAARTFAPRFTKAGAPCLAAEWKIRDAETGRILGEFDRNLRIKSFNSLREGMVLLEKSKEYLAEDIAVSIKKVLAKSRSE
ncbi:MAG: DUF4410 domain-containing protein [Sedimentisphaerales bacterium]|nr:DUF4410 domain-containing protein [Sedimentisphaerales bacterium]